MIARIRRLGERLRRDERGAVGPAVAVLAVPLMLCAGLALDVALYYSGNRELRIATEAAALAAAMEPGRADVRARDYLKRNGYSDTSILKKVELGYYCADRDKASGSRFSLTADGCAGSLRGQNAVRLTTQQKSRQFLLGLLGRASPIPALAATASASRIDEAGVAVSSDILKLSGLTGSLIDLVNTLLGALLNLKLTLTDPDIRGLMSGNVDAGRFFDALAKRAGQTGTYAEMMTKSYGIKDIALAAADAAYAPATATALRNFGGMVNNTYQVPFSAGGVPLFGLGVWKNMPVGEADVKPALRAGLNAYQLIAFAVQAGPGAIDLSNLVGLAIPNSTVRLAAVANGPMAQPRFSFGARGEAGVSTSQVRLKLNVGLPDISLLGNVIGIKSVPVLIDIAPATAVVSDIACSGSTEQINDTRVTVNTTSGLVRAYIAEVPDSVMSKQMPALPTPTAANLINLDLTNVLGINVLSVKANVKVVAGDVTGASGPLYFGPNDAGKIGTPDTPGRSLGLRNQSQVGATLGSLITQVPSGVDVNVKVLGVLDLGLGKGLLGSIVGGITTPLGGLVGTTVGSTVDPLLDNLLAALGVQLGDATVWVTGARCGVPVLI
ncbi:pilus assembly protein TadG-related protein [Novosphingobium resinovorum]|uniref:pilus assembly protein TadG-related protein n=1 Tax=Novosphingobium resinovorum TaxID=158500 RepID=UPI002ED2DAE2|nr:pilus assembly protein TadG-related protein [Novosphingobium resinovorum]